MKAHYTPRLQTSNGRKDRGRISKGPCLLVAVLIMTMLACSPYPANVRQSLKMAAENRPELEQVLDHYRNDPNPEKFQAACFLIGNMQDKYYLEGEIITAYDTLFHIIDGMFARGLPVYNMFEYIQQQWDSIATIHGLPVPANATICPELLHIKGATLIGHIDQAFHIRDSVPWGKDIPFEDFCQYVLPHRMGNELPEDWRTYLYHKSLPLRDTTQAKDRATLARQLNMWIKREVIKRHNRTFWSYSIDLPPSKLEMSRMGSCKHTVFYIAMLLRAHGIPVGVDYVPLWAGARAGHEWNVLLCQDGSFHPFDAISNTFDMPLTDRKIAKVFRMTFTPQTGSMPPGNSSISIRLRRIRSALGLDSADGQNDLRFSEEIPQKFYNPYIIDVTHEYVKTFDVQVPLNEKTKNRYALICTFNNQEWVPQYWGRIRRGKALFPNMGSGVAYRVMALREGTLEGLSEPFILDTLGNMQQLIPSSKKIDVRLQRKYLLTQFMKGLMAYVVNHPFHGANRADFSDSVCLFTIRQTPLNMATAIIHEPREFRYARYYGSHMAEVEFYGTEPNKLNPNLQDTVLLRGRILGYPRQDPKIKTPYEVMFDGDLGNYFEAPDPKGAWGGMDFGRPRRIVKIRYCPRSDTNFIVPGNEYELLYWDKGNWISMGRKVATQQFLEYQNVPSGALYLLHNHTGGTEERIFTLQNGKQVFW
mgnify:FL=1